MSKPVFVETDLERLRRETRTRCFRLKLTPECVCCGEMEPAFLSLTLKTGEGDIGGIRLWRATKMRMSRMRRQGILNSRLEVHCRNCLQAVTLTMKCPHKEQKRIKNSSSRNIVLHTSGTDFNSLAKNESSRWLLHSKEASFWESVQGIEYVRRALHEAVIEARWTVHDTGLRTLRLSEVTSRLELALKHQVDPRCVADVLRTHLECETVSIGGPLRILENENLSRIEMSAFKSKGKRPMS